ncbi:hypothetical protein VTJ49DRAFT_311 [Mycothermus thermophilus]|uniref:Uncharacterized protein n=1 Tax=Humicola insolens TaxID=85995 RepID=A0ABR3VFD2_HUMIN
MVGSARHFLDRILPRCATSSESRPARSPSVGWLLSHRDERSGKRALCEGNTPVASLYRMYEYLVVGYNTGLRTEIEYFFNQPSWSVSAIPDPEDPDPERYAILSVLPSYLAMAFNRLIERGLVRAAPAIIMPDMEDEMRNRPQVLEEEPSWAAQVPALEQTLIIPDESNKTPKEDWRFIEKKVIVEEPHVLFVW